MPRPAASPTGVRASGGDSGLAAASADQGVRDLHRGRRPRPRRAARARSSPCSARPGCGKTTTLRMVAGLEDADRRARSRSAAQDITYAKPYQRPVNTVFQSYALFPHLDIFENVAFGLRRRGVKDVKQQVDEMLELVELGSQARKKPAQLSGGQQQRVALARALINQPAGAAARRAARRARPQAAPADADRAQADPDRGRPHLRPRHPRPGGGHDDGRHHRGDERGRDRADGRARRSSTRTRGRRSSPTSSASPT